MLLVGTAPATAQIAITYTFVDGTTASATEVNTNFSQLAAAALNRTGGTITGNIAVNAGITIDGVDISASFGAGTGILGVAFGGTGANLTATGGGAAHFVKQASVGSVLTIGQPAIADLSDASNLALLNAVNTFTAFGTHLWSAGGTGANTLRVRNTTAGTGNYAVIEIGNDAVVNLGGFFGFSSTFTSSGANFAAGTLVQANGAGGLSLQASHASGGIRLYTAGSSQKWGINTLNDITIGASAHIMDPFVTPTIVGFGFASGGTIVGTGYAFLITNGGTPASGTVTFVTSYSNPPVCVASTSVGTVLVSAVTTGGMTITLGTPTAGQTVYVLCRGY
jgi:hypothetical protein